MVCPEKSLSATLDAVQRSGIDIRLLFDCDGALVPATSFGEAATPEADVVALIGELASTAGMRVDVVSGRCRVTMDEWFAALPISIWAEDGLWYRAAPDRPWHSASALPSNAIERIKRIVEVCPTNTAGVAAHRIEREIGGTLLIAVGGDDTDDDFFRALPASSLTITVGSRSRCARFRVDDHNAVREALRSLAADRRSR